MKKILIIIAAGFTIYGCEKGSGFTGSGIPGGETAKFRVAHMSPDAPSFNLMMDSIKATAVAPATSGAEQGLAFGGFSPVSSYAGVPAGAYTVSARVPWSSATLPGQTIASEPYTFSNGFYTIALVDSLSRLDLLIIEDDLDIPDTSKAYYRIANFMPNGSADVSFNGITNPGYMFNRNGLAFKSVTAFDTITAATYKIYLRANGGTNKLDSINAFAPAKGRKYTLYARGVVGLTGTNTKRPLIFQTTTL